MRSFSAFYKWVLIAAIVLPALASCAPIDGRRHGGAYPYGETRVPDILGRSIQEAGDVLYNYDLRVGGVDYVKTDYEGLDREVLYQHPKPGRLVPAGTRVRLKVYQYVGQSNVTPPHGRHRIRTPDLVGQTVDAARLLLRRHHLYVGKIHYIQTRSGRLAGKVDSQNPTAGTKIAKGSAVRLNVYRYKDYTPSEGIMRVPNVRLMKLNHARKIIRKSGLKVGRITYIFTSKPEHDYVVFTQNPSKGSRVAKGYAVDLKVYRTNWRPVHEKKVSAPRVIGMKLHAANKILENHQLNLVEVFFVDTSSRKRHNRVKNQSPGPGVRLRKDDVVQLTVYRYRSGPRSFDGDYDD